MQEHQREEQTPTAARSPSSPSSFSSSPDASESPSSSTAGSSALSPASASASSSESSIFRSSLGAGFASLAASPSHAKKKNKKKKKKKTTSPKKTSSDDEPIPPPPSSPTSSWTSPAQTTCFVQFVEPDRDLYYPTIDTILHRDLASTIRVHVPYVHPRTGRRDIIDCLSLRTISTTGAAFQAQRSLLADVVSLPTEEVHLQPLCYVYVAGCAGLDHYRSKVRPDVQAFVREVEAEAAAAAASVAGGDGNGPDGGDEEGSAGGDAASSGSGSGSGSPSPSTRGHYVIIYVPLPSASSSSSDHPRGRKGGKSSRSVSSSSTGSSDSGTATTGAVGGGVSAPSTEVSAKERDMLRKFNLDFPQRVCMLSTLLDYARHAAAASSSAGRPGLTVSNPYTFSSTTAATTGSPTTLFQSEWDKFLKHLGGTMVESFKHRCKLYDEELRRLLDVKRLGTGEFDFKRYVLVKESLAFTYEQMRLYREALIHYQEMDAIVPDDDDVDEEGGEDGESPPGSPSSIIQTLRAETSNYAAAGDTDGFRKVLGSTPPVPVTASQYNQYFFARECHLLTALHRPVEIIRKARDFVVNSYRTRLADDKCGPTEAESWALSACWDVKLASERYFTFADTSGEEEEVVVDDDDEEDREAARQLSELLEFGRQRLLRLGELELGEDLAKKSPARLATRERPPDTYEDWIPWRDLPHHRAAAGEGPTASPSRTTSEGKGSPSGGGAADVPETPPGGVSAVRRRHDSSFLGGALASADAFEAKYLELSDAIICLYKHAGRNRLASRMLGEQAEVLILRGDYASAARILVGIVDGCARDGWHGLYLWRLFRLACCQRRTGDAPSYLGTLIKCFHPRFNSSESGPRRVTGLFQDDLECLVQEDVVRNARLGVAPFLETDITVEQVSLGRRSQPLGFLRKKLVNSRCHVGEKMTITLGITSHLPRKITVDSVRLFVIKYEAYERACRTEGLTLHEGGSFRVLSESGPITVEPGTNVRRFHWIPMTVGRYVLEGVEIRWGKACFAHESASLRKSIQGIEVLPSDSTQRVELNPLFLIPGEKQEIRLAVFSRDDIITEGNVELSCSHGLRVLRPDMLEDQPGAWCDKCVVALDPCGPDTHQTVKTLVKSEAVRAGQSSVQTMRATVVSSYHHRLYKDLTEDDEPEGPPMETTLEAMVTTLDRPALTFNKSEAFSLSKTSVMVSVSVLCNTPTPFFIKEWDVHFPPPLVLADGGDDANDVLVGHPVVVGQEIFFGFSCNRVQESNGDAGERGDTPDKPTLCIVLRDDQGKTFRQVLTLDLDSFYEKMRAEDEYSGVNTASAELKCSSGEGVVGGPVKFTYVVDVSLISATKRKTPPRSSSSFAAIESDDGPPASSPPLLYSIACDKKHWVLGGKMRGAVQRESTGTFSVDFIGIPTHSGMLKHFPEITMYYAPSELFASPAITVHCHVPESFMSLSFKNHMALAAPTLVDTASGVH